MITAAEIARSAMRKAVTSPSETSTTIPRAMVIEIRMVRNSRASRLARVSPDASAHTSSPSRIVQAPTMVTTVRSTAVSPSA